MFSLILTSLISCSVSYCDSASSALTSSASRSDPQLPSDLASIDLNWVEPRPDPITINFIYRSRNHDESLERTKDWLKLRSANVVKCDYWLGFSLGDGASSLVVTFFGVSSGGVRDELGTGELILGSPISLGGFRVGLFRRLQACWFLCSFWMSKLISAERTFLELRVHSGVAL